ncbi:endolytic transglycosylase MltG [Rubeoparvulum massiliense]|uniref:endolytic transglycosylase MltG n=1 Tax=Rubeoparvulum massiliense TaxID=1631346 RepID=UPI000AF3CE34|nr:endolytic transglycosylase MltG [Rubeoparvulum massiliense]
MEKDRDQELKKPGEFRQEESLRHQEDHLVADEEDEELEPTSKLKVALITILTVFILFAVVIGGGALYVYTNLQPVNSVSVEPVRVEIPSGATPKKIATILEENGLIRSGFIYSYYLKWKGDGVSSRLQAGTYDFVPGTSLEELTNKMVQGVVVQVDTKRITIPEGWNVNQIADYLSGEGLVNRDTFIQEINMGNFSYDFLSEITQEEGANYRLEGFLFPDTYDVPKGASEHEIIDMMLRNFDKKVTAEIRTGFEQQRLSFYDAITLASIVEREVILDEERPIVAGVFYNRMEDHIRLESCATVQYVLGKQKDVITFDDLEVESPYNTYKHDGLPPGPIGNPGLASIQSVAAPQDNDYYFFVTKKDGSKSHHFSRTYEEHLKNDAKSRGSW